MELILFYPILIFSVVCHEVAHGLVALKQGDDTALHSGRLTLNPLPHLDWMGSVVFPLLCVFMRLPAFGWAKPVPINPNRFRRYRSGVVLVSLAGPLTNFLIAIVFAGAFYLLAVSGSSFLNIALVPRLISQVILLNLVLMVFNLFPIPPLDGSRVLSVLLPYELAARYDSLEPYGFFIIMGLLAFGILGRVLFPIVEGLYRLMMSGIGVF